MRGSRRSKRVVALNPTERRTMPRRRRRTGRRRTSTLARRRRRRTRRNPLPVAANPRRRRRRRRTIGARRRRRTRSYRRNPLPVAANPRRRRRRRSYRRNPVGGKLTARRVSETLVHLAGAGVTAAVTTSVVEYWLDNLAGRALENGWLDGVSGGDPGRAAGIAAWGGDALQLMLGGITAITVAPRVKNRAVRAGLEYGLAFGAMTRMVKRAVAMATTPAEPTAQEVIQQPAQQAVGRIPQVADDLMMLPDDPYGPSGYNAGNAGNVEGWMWDGDQLVGGQSVYDAGALGM